MVNQAMRTTVTFRSNEFNLTNRKLRFGNFLVDTNPLSKKSLCEPQALEYTVSPDRYIYYILLYIPYAGVAGMLLQYCETVSF